MPSAEKTRILHPYLFGLFPALFVFSENIRQVRALDIVAPALILLAVVYVLQRAVSRILCNEFQAAAIVSLFVGFLFSYHAFSALLLKVHIGTFVFSRSMYRMAVYVPLFLVAGWLVLSVRAKYREMTKVLNLVSIVLVSLSLFRGGVSGLQLLQSKAAVAFNGTPRVTGQSQAGVRGVSPDIYYIILDGYAREDVLRSVFGYDNRSFVDALEKKGFYFPKQARTNYVLTALSLPSSLGMAYNGGDVDRSHLVNEAKTFLDGKGYSYIGIGSIMQQHAAQSSYSPYDLFVNEFTLLLLRQSVIDSIASRYNIYAYFVRKSILYDFEMLKSAPLIKGKKFVYAHIMSPHPPYVFGPQGEPSKLAPLSISMNIFKTPWDNKKAYVDQLQFINRKTIEVIEILLRDSAQPPIIIIQSDHGPHLSIERKEEMAVCMRILNTYYFPKGGRAVLYDSITPVNTFRVLFNYYFDAKLPLLEDRSYYSTFSAPQKFEDVTSLVSGSIDSK